jgi:uncharacterized protein YccT (UPF0319 family)
MLVRFCLRALMLFMSLILFGCASDRVVKTYEGDVLSEETIAVLTAPENITLLSVNGIEVQQYLLSNIEVNYGLKAGENLVVFKYESVWAKAKKDQETGPYVDVVESEPLEVLIKAKPGAKYNFSFLPPNNVREAKEFALAFEVTVVDDQKNLISEPVSLNTYKIAKEQILQEEQALLLGKEAERLASLKSGGGVIIDQLKAIWPSASADEKKEFLVWVFQK